VRLVHDLHAHPADPRDRDRAAVGEGGGAVA
jgi:hypothetical protein